MVVSGVNSIGVTTYETKSTRVVNSAEKNYSRRKRLLRSWNNERQMPQVSVTYEAGTVVSDASYSEQVYNV